MGRKTANAGISDVKEISGKVRVVVGCASRKRAPIPPQLRLSSISVKETRARAEAWLERLRTEPVETRPARQLYAGDHWQVVLSILSSRAAAVVSIVSAGYGLIAPDTPVKPYSATFSAGLDSVVTNPTEARSAGREWWEAIAEAPGPNGEPRTLAALARAEPDGVMVVALSASYLRALRDDLLAAAARKRLRGRLVVISAGTRRFDGANDEFVPTGAHLQRAMGGSRNSLNARIARYLLDKSASHEWDASKIVTLIRRLGERPPASDRRYRARMTDAALLDYINRGLRQDPRASKSRLLRRLRNGGQSCEQGRFGELYAQVRAG